VLTLNKQEQIDETAANNIAAQKNINKAYNFCMGLTDTEQSTLKG
jgi:hypothetical protein